LVIIRLLRIFSFYDSLIRLQFCADSTNIA